MSKPKSTKETTATRLLEYVKNYIKENEISSGEAVFQVDSLSLDALNFMEKCCEIVGYHEYEEE